MFITWSASSSITPSRCSSMTCAKLEREKGLLPNQWLRKLCVSWQLTEARWRRNSPRAKHQERRVFISDRNKVSFDWSDRPVQPVKDRCVWVQWNGRRSGPHATSARTRDPIIAELQWPLSKNDHRSRKSSQCRDPVLNSFVPSFGDRYLPSIGQDCELVVYNYCCTMQIDFGHRELVRGWDHEHSCPSTSRGQAGRRVEIALLEEGLGS